ncbi:hypothetical protein DVH24_037898 [Malus domestica]|uniref:THH1/TOM1/TOM3 domain-containing protein n=1 Tax=Malus domestica TaxID=3750 RepID=A0A498JWR9_MALDO|nr:hypothetical protein DVH24_037898 [Malus domestica]
MMIARKGLVFNFSGDGGGGGGGGEGGGLQDWWNQDKKQWGSGGGSSSTYYILCASYGLVSLVALVQLVRIQLRVPEYGWTIQKVFHLMNFLVNGLRALLFGLFKTVFLIKPKALEMLLMDLPGLLFFSTYTLLVLFWAEIYHQARSLPTDKLRPAYYVINGLVSQNDVFPVENGWTQCWINFILLLHCGRHCFLVCIWIFLRLSRSPVAVEVARIFFSVISFCTALGFLIYGGRQGLLSALRKHPSFSDFNFILVLIKQVLFIMLRRFPIESRGRQKKLEEVCAYISFISGSFQTQFLQFVLGIMVPNLFTWQVGWVTGICCTCFLIRCIVLAVSAFDKDADVDVIGHPILNLLAEIVPSALVLFILRKLPPRRVSDQYQPIS